MRALTLQDIRSEEAKDEYLLIQKALFKFSLVYNIHKHKTQYKIYITAKSLSKFKTLVILYFYKIIIYKLN